MSFGDKLLLGRGIDEADAAPSSSHYILGAAYRVPHLPRNKSKYCRYQNLDIFIKPRNSFFSNLQLTHEIVSRLRKLLTLDHFMYITAAMEQVKRSTNPTFE